MSIHSISQASNLTEIEKSILAEIDAQEKHAVTLLENLVNINSGTMNFAGVRQVGNIFKDEFESLGFETKWIEGEAFNRAGHFVAKSGDQGVKLLLIGHLDTVFSQDSKFQRYSPKDNNLVTGPGITDMKGGDVVLLQALKALKKVGALENMRIQVILTGDEEKRGRPLDVATKALIDAGIWADIAIGFEDGDGNPKTAVVSRRGSVSWKLSVTGKANHSSQIFRKDYGYGSIFEAARILNAFREQLRHETNLTYNPGLILGGTEADLESSGASGSAYGKTNVIPQSTIVMGDIRALSPEQLSRAKKIMEDIVKNNLDETTAHIQFEAGYPPMAPSKGNHKLLDIFNNVSLDLGFGEVKAVDPLKAGAADISFVAEQVEMAIDGLGLMGSGGHTKFETADMSTLDQQTKRAALLMYRLSQTH